MTKLSGRTELSKKIRDALTEKYGCKCFIYLEEIDQSELQIDHRVPYEVGGVGTEDNPEDFMLLSGSANRAKSWSCEHCENWNNSKERPSKKVCRIRLIYQVFFTSSLTEHWLIELRIKITSRSTS